MSTATLTALSHSPADPIDRLLSLTGDQVLRMVETEGGEYDSLAQVSTSARRRIASARLVSSHGLPADELLVIVQCSDQCPPILVDANPDQFVTWYVGECLTGLDMRADARNGRTVWHEQTEPEPWPTELEEWIGRLVFGAKVELLGQLAAWRYEGAKRPSIPDTAWAGKLYGRFVRSFGVPGKS